MNEERELSKKLVKKTIKTGTPEQIKIAIQNHFRIYGGKPTFKKEDDYSFLDNNSFDKFLKQ